MNVSTEKNLPLPLESIVCWLRERAGRQYGGEAVTQLEHALQCATLAQDDGASPALITAALLHDIGHLADPDDEIHPHAHLASALLQAHFEPAVTEAVRLHVAAKQYLCAVDAGYWSSLSAASQRSLEWQGGPFSPAQASQFIAQPFAQDAVLLRQWDDRAKLPEAKTPDLDYFIDILHSVSRQKP